MVHLQTPWFFYCTGKKILTVFECRTAVYASVGAGKVMGSGCFHKVSSLITDQNSATEALISGIAREA